MSLIKDPSGETILVTIRIKKHELAECLRRMPQHGTIHDSLYNAFSFGLFAIYELESEDRELLRRLVEEWRSQYRRPNDARLIGKTDDELLDEFYGSRKPSAPTSAEPSSDRTSSSASQPPAEADPERDVSSPADRNSGGLVPRRSRSSER